MLCIVLSTLFIFVPINEVNAAGATPYPSTQPRVELTPTPQPYPSVTPMSAVRANKANNKIFWIRYGATYRADATLQFYATGDGYGPEEQQELYPTYSSTRYIPVSWAVKAQRAVDSMTTNKVTGTWKRYTEIAGGTAINGFYSPSEYRFKASFKIKTGVGSIPYQLTVKYKGQIYDGRKWMDTKETTLRSVNFYIKNVNINSNSEFSIPNNSKFQVGDKEKLIVSGVLSKVTFSSSNKKVATIGKSSGKITALKVGTTTITAKAPAFGQYNAFRKSITIKVIPKMVKIKSLKSNKKGQLTIKSDSNNVGNTGYKIRYKYAGGKTTTIDVKSKKSLNYTIKKLKSKKKYSICVCAYKKVGNKFFNGYYTVWKSVGKIK